MLSWGVYGAMLHQGQVKLPNPMRALLCVGVPYFLIGVLVPIAPAWFSLWDRGCAASTLEGTTGATLAGALGALGAVCIIFAFRTGGTPTCRDAARLRRRAAGERPLHDESAPAQGAVNPLLYLGFLVTAVGAGMVLYFKPPAH